MARLKVWSRHGAGCGRRCFHRSSRPAATGHQPARTHLPQSQLWLPVLRSCVKPHVAALEVVLEGCQTGCALWQCVLRAHEMHGRECHVEGRHHTLMYTSLIYGPSGRL